MPGRAVCAFAIPRSYAVFTQIMVGGWRVAGVDMYIIQACARAPCGAPCRLLVLVSQNDCVDLSLKTVVKPPARLFFMPLCASVANLVAC